jgi:hypothetical protein
VSNHPEDFAEAYWAVNTLQVFQNNGDTASGSSDTQTSQAMTSTNTNTHKGSGGNRGRFSRPQKLKARSEAKILPIYL